MGIYERIVFQNEYYLTLDQNYIHETKIYCLNFEKSILQMYPKIYYNLARIMNEILLIPFELKLQKRGLNLMRRFYNLYPNLREHIVNPLKVLLSNISLFAENSNETKDAAIFLYQLLQNNENKDFVDMLKNNENLKFIKESKYFSIKAMSYPQEIDTIYNIRSLNLNCFYSNKKIIDAESSFYINLFIKHEHSLIYWKFTTLHYDIGFGLYKFNVLEDVPVSKIDEYTKNGKIECVIQNQRVFSNQSYITVKNLKKIYIFKILSYKLIFYILGCNFNYCCWIVSTDFCKNFLI